jgi:hypothetical protein
MKSPFQVNSEKPFSMPQTMPSIPSGKASLKGFSNTTLSQGNSKLMVSVGKTGGTSIVYLQYIEVANTYTVTIMESLARNASSSPYSAVLGANIVPTGVDLKLGDVFVLNYTSTLTNQLAGNAAGLGIVALQDIASHNTTIRQLGSYYGLMVISFLKMGAMLPKSTANLNVGRTISVDMDQDCELVCEIVILVVVIVVDVLCLVTIVVCVVAIPVTYFYVEEFDYIDAACAAACEALGQG